jgi:hypothetical protein
MKISVGSKFQEKSLLFQKVKGKKSHFIVEISMGKFKLIVKEFSIENPSSKELNNYPNNDW